MDKSNGVNFAFVKSLNPFNYPQKPFKSFLLQLTDKFFIISTFDSNFEASNHPKTNVATYRFIPMKKLLILLVIHHLSFNLFAQSGTMLPDGFVIPNLSAEPACTVADKGKMYYNTTISALKVCNGTNWLLTSSRWSTDQAAPNTLNYGQGSVGINTTTPSAQYKLDVNGTARVQGLLVTGISVGGTTTNSGFEVTDGDIAIKSTVDNKAWKFDYSDANNSLSLQEDGTARMVFANGGNVGIGSVIPTAKLSVDGTGSFTGNLTVNGGKGIVRTTSASSFKTHIAPVSLGASFTVTAGNCATSSPSISSASFLAAPTAQIGNLVSGSGDFGKLVINVQSTTASIVIVRFCNNTANNITLSNMVFNLLCVGN